MDILFPLCLPVKVVQDHLVLVNCTGCITCLNTVGTVILFSKGTYSGTSSRPRGDEAGRRQAGHLSGIRSDQSGQGGQQQPLQSGADGPPNSPPDPIEEPARTRSIRLLIC
jgi:hypothetical protein